MLITHCLLAVGCEHDVMAEVDVGVDFTVYHHSN